MLAGRVHTRWRCRQQTEEAEAERMRRLGHRSRPWRRAPPSKACLRTRSITCAPGTRLGRTRHPPRSRRKGLPRSADPARSRIRVIARASGFRAHRRGGHAARSPRRASSSTVTATFSPFRFGGARRLQPSAGRNVRIVSFFPCSWLWMDARRTADQISSIKGGHVRFPRASRRDRV